MRGIRIQSILRVSGRKIGVAVGTATVDLSKTNVLLSC